MILKLVKLDYKDMKNSLYKSGKIYEVKYLHSHY